MTQRDYQNGRLLNFYASENFEHGANVVGVGAVPSPPPDSSPPDQPAGGGIFSSQNLAGTLTTGVSWVRLGVALLPLLFRGKKK